MTVLLIIATLLSGSLTAAQDNDIRNFQVVSRNSTHITFSWDIVDGYYTSSYINSFRLYYQHRSSTQSLYIPYSSATHNGATFRYTSSVGNFNNGPYIMWVQVYRSSALDPRYTYSRRTYVNIGKVDMYTILELKVHLQSTQTCSDFLLGPPYSRFPNKQTRLSSEVYWILHDNCRCTLPYDLSVEDGYFTCTTSDYVIFRAKLSTSDPSIDLSSLKAHLNNFLTEQDKEARITLDGGGYLVEPGPCGLTVPHLTSPHCWNNTPTQAAVSNTPQDSTAVTTIVAIMCGTMLIVVLSGCIVFLVMGLKKMQSNTTEVKATRDLEMASAGPSGNIPLPHGHDHVYASAEVPIQPNPSYGIVK